MEFVQTRGNEIAGGRFQYEPASVTIALLKALKKVGVPMFRVSDFAYALQGPAILLKTRDPKFGTMFKELSLLSGLGYSKGSHKFFLDVDGTPLEGMDA